MKQQIRSALGAFVLALCLGVLALGPAQAQTEQQPPQQPQQEMQQTEFTEDQLESFVDAAVTVNDLIESWRPRITAAESEEQAAQLREQANEELAEAIEQTEGMSLEEYQQIGQAAQADPELSERINEIYQARLEQ